MMMMMMMMTIRRRRNKNNGNENKMHILIHWDLYDDLRKTLAVKTLQ